MSGIVGIAYSDGEPVDRELLLRMTRRLSFCGPDSQRVWTEGSVGLGHAAHLVGGDTSRAPQPESLGTGTWITADVRLDARDELLAQLRAQKPEATASSSDSQLLLHAYDRWGEQCLDHVIGDFAFGLWDARRQQLFCACDHFGIRQLYYSKAASCLVFSNTLDAVRLHPDVSNRLNDAAICDFLLFGMNYEERTTSFADIERLPRAHWLRWSANGLVVGEYWRPPTDEEIRYEKRREYIEHFNQLIVEAVRDRARADNVGILLSGGIDSSSVAAVCREIGARRGYPREIHAFTATDENAADADGGAARSVADALGVPVHFYCWNVHDMPLFEGWGFDGVRWPEPVDDPFAGVMRKQFREIAAHVPLLFSGEGIDNLMEFEPGAHLRNLWRQGRRTQAVLDVAEHAARRLGAPDGLRGPLRRIPNWLWRKESKVPFPSWLNPDLVTELKLGERWLDPTPGIPWNAHVEHPVAYGSLFFPQWRYLFERHAPSYTRAAVELRYPFLDLRLVKYLLAIPVMPWSFRKLLLREAMRGRLPRNIRRRPKRPVRRDPLIEGLKWRREGLFSEQSVAPNLNRYVNVASVIEPRGEGEPGIARLKLRPWCLNLWLAGLRNDGM